MKIGVVSCVLLVACSASAAKVAIVRGKQSAQFDLAVAAIKGELPGMTAEVVIDDAATTSGVQQQLAAMQPTVVVAVGARAAQLAADGARPVVACMILQESAAPSSTIRIPAAVPLGAQLDALRSLSPASKRIGVLYDPKYNAAEVKQARAAAASRSLTIVAREVTDSRDAPAALDALLNEIDAVLLLADATVVSKAFLQYLVKRAFDRHMPVLTYSDSFVRLGLLAALVPSYAENGKLAGAIARAIVDGADPKRLTPPAMTGELVVNASTARKIGLTLAPKLLQPPTVVVGEP